MVRLDLFLCRSTTEEVRRSWTILLNLMTDPFTLGRFHISGHDVSLTPGFLWAASYAAYFCCLEPIAGVRLRLSCLCCECG